MAPKRKYPTGSGVYVITNTVTGRRYYGRGRFAMRFPQHWHALRRNGHHNMELQVDWNKFGEQNFTFEILHQLGSFSQKEKELEREAILSDPTCYNCDALGWKARLNGAFQISHPVRNNRTKNQK